MEPIKCFFHVPVMRPVRYNSSSEYLYIIRAFDIMVLAIALVIFVDHNCIITINRRSGAPVFISDADKKK